MGIVACFILLILWPGTLSGCDMTAFVQSDFAARCQLLQDLSDKTFIARRVSHPDLQAHVGNLSREWVRFFLAHGQAENRPPSLSFVASSTWETAVKELGMAVAATTRGEIDEPAFELLRFKIGLFKDAAGLKTVHQALKASVNASASSSIQWLQIEYLGPADVIAEHVQTNPTLMTRLQTSVAMHFSAAERIDRLAASETAAIVAAVADNFKKEVRADRRFWERLFFCDY